MDNLRNFYHTYSYVARGNKMCDRFEDASVIRTTARHHIYNIGKTLQSRKEPNNDCIDSFAVAITENDKVSAGVSGQGVIPDTPFVIH